METNELKITQEEADVAAVAENAVFMQEQINVLNKRVIILRVQLNQALQEIERLYEKHPQERPSANKPADRKRPARKSTPAKRASTST